MIGLSWKMYRQKKCLAHNSVKGKVVMSLGYGGSIVCRNHSVTAGGLAFVDEIQYYGLFAFWYSVSNIIAELLLLLELIIGIFEIDVHYLLFNLNSHILVRI